MIVQMKKVCLVVQDSFCDIALNKLREVGVYHIEKGDIPVDINSSAQKRKVKVDDAIGLIRDFKMPKVKPVKKKKGEIEDTRPGYERRQKPIGLKRGRRATDIFGTEEEEPYSLSAIRAPARPELSDYMLGIDKTRKVLKERDIFLSHEIARLQGWGNFDPKTIKEITKGGMPVFLYEIFNDDFEDLDDDVKYIKINKNKSVVLILVFEKEINGIAPFKLPERSLNEFMEEAAVIRANLKEVNDKIKSFANRRPTLDKEMLKVMQDIEFEEAMANLCEIENLDIVGAGKQNLSALSYLTGYVPDEDLEKVKTVARENNWGLSSYDPADDDEKIPTKLKNTWFVNLLNPVTGFLGLLPGYRETDISRWFLIFFTIFFGMIFADAAYGAIIMLIAVVFILKSVFNKERRLQNRPVNQGLFLLLLLGISNTAWGVLTCSWFGLELDKVPQILKDMSLSLISEAKGTPKEVATANIQFFCFSLGLLHLSVAHLNNFFRYIKTPRCLADLGCISMLFGMFNLVLLLIVGPDYTVIPQGEGFVPTLLCFVGAGFVFNFLFSSYKTSMKQALKGSLSNVITLVLSIVNVFSDIMSYLRLWAVGLAGAAISVTVNTLVGPTIGTFMVFLGIILFIFGHGLNMVLCVLSVLVHGVRLNTLEFSGHVGLNWSGKTYKPFAKIEIK